METEVPVPLPDVRLDRDLLEVPAAIPEVQALATAHGRSDLRRGHEESEAKGAGGMIWRFLGAVLAGLMIVAALAMALMMAFRDKRRD
jgi:hypothetical protein